MTIRAVVFDFGGVLFDWNPHHLYRKLIADDHERQWFLDTICTQAWNTEQDAGRTLAEATRSLVAQYPQHETLITAYYDRWHEMLRGPLPEGVAILEALHHADMPLFGLTNWSAETFPPQRDRFPFLSWFDGIVVSGEEGVIKPDPRIFRILLERYAIPPEAAVFIDDDPANAAAATSLGMHGIHFRSPDLLRRELRALGLL